MQKQGAFAFCSPEVILCFPPAAEAEWKLGGGKKLGSKSEAIHRMHFCSVLPDSNLLPNAFMSVGEKDMMAFSHAHYDGNYGYALSPVHHAHPHPPPPHIIGPPGGGGGGWVSPPALGQKIGPNGLLPPPPGGGGVSPSGDPGGPGKCSSFTFD